MSSPVCACDSCPCWNLLLPRRSAATEELSPPGSPCSSCDVPPSLPAHRPDGLSWPGYAPHTLPGAIASVHTNIRSQAGTKGEQFQVVTDLWSFSPEIVSPVWHGTEVDCDQRKEAYWDGTWEVFFCLFHGLAWWPMHFIILFFPGN